MAQVNPNLILNSTIWDGDFHWVQIQMILFDYAGYHLAPTIVGHPVSSFLPRFADSRMVNAFFKAHARFGTKVEFLRSLTNSNRIEDG